MLKFADVKFGLFLSRSEILTLTKNLQPTTIHENGGQAFLQEKYEAKLRVLLETMYGGNVKETEDDGA